MDWTEQRVRDRLATTLDAPAPAERNKEAAVAIVLRFASQTPSHPTAEVLLIRRAEQEGDPWSGHMAFPGGHREPTDRDLLATAIRETQEELGIDLSAEAELLGRLPEIPAVARGRRIDLVIVPFVFAAHAPLMLAPGPEVDEALWTELEPLVSGSADTVRPYVLEGYPLQLPAYQVGEHVVWGLTYRMLTVLFEALGA